MSQALTDTSARPAPAAVSGPGWRVIPALAAVIVVLIPMAYLAIRATEVPWSDVVTIVTASRAGEYALNTVVLGFSVSVTVLVAGVAIAVGLSRSRVSRLRWWLVASALPLAMPSYLASYGWLVIWPTLSGFGPSWLLLSAVTIPYVVLPTVAALLYTVSDFGLVAMLRFHTLTWGINAAYSASFDRNQAAVLALLIVLIALVGVLGERRVRGQRRLSLGRLRPVGPALVPWVRRSLFVAMLTPLALGIVVPMAGLISRLVQAETLQAIDPARLAEATGWTVLVAVSAALTATLIALPIAALAAKYRTRLASTIESLGYLSHALPGIVVGLSLVFLTLGTLPVLYQTLAILIFGYTVLFASKSIGATRASIEGVSGTLIRVARTLGETPFGAWRRVTLPLALPGILVGALLVMVATMKELPATLILRPTGTNTLATELWTKTVAVEYAQAAPYAALLVLVAAIPAMFLAATRSEKGEAT
jgi:iron(III) transport system permease protein